jgi:hypothetical protein
MTETATPIEFGMGSVPDDPPAFGTDDAAGGGTGPYSDLYPDSTPEAPYGYKPDGTPYKRHHGAGRKNGAVTGSNMPGAKQAATAAALLARMNVLFGIAFTAAGMPESARALADNNSDFESMARDALEADPALCKKILSVGATSGKAGLVMAYVMLGVNTYPAMRAEYRENHPKEIGDEGSGYDVA